MKTLMENICKDQANWFLEEAEGRKARFPLSIPGMPAAGKEKDVKALKVYRKEFFSCTSCRWSLTGAGCCYCNPVKHQILLDKKARLAKELQIALNEGLEKLKAQGMIHAHTLETGTSLEPEKPLEGGGEYMTGDSLGTL